MKNAFELLAAGARGSSKPSSKTPAGSKGTYATCPLCQRSVPLSFADAHVSVCLATPGPQHPRLIGSLRSPAPDLSTPQHQQQLPAPRRGTPAATPQPQATPGPPPSLQRKSQQPSHQQTHLGCNPDGLELIVINDNTDVTGPDGSAEDTMVVSDDAVPGALEPRGDAAPTAAPLPTHPGPQIADLATQQATQPLSCSQAVNGVNAFDVMRQSQLRAATRCHTFFLERTSEGAWLGHYWAKGSATPAQQRLAATSCWSVTLTVGGSGGGGGRGDAAASRETVVLLTNVPPGHGGVLSWSSGDLPSNDLPPEGRWRGGPSALKSALQKAVRLGRGACAVRTALHLVKEEGGPAQLLRRLSVVCVEDAILHPGLPLVVWLMAAQAKGFILGCTHVEALLALTYQLAMVQVRDGLPDPWDGGGSAAPGAGAQGPSTLRQVDEMALPAAEGCLVKCLLFRASYGGMGGDVRMMRAFAGYWAARFKGEAAGPPAPTYTAPEAGQGHRPGSGSSAFIKQASSSATAGPPDVAPMQPAPTRADAPCSQPHLSAGALGTDPGVHNGAAQQGRGPSQAQSTQPRACTAAGSPPEPHLMAPQDGALACRLGSCRKRGCAEVVTGRGSKDPFRVPAAESVPVVPQVESAMLPEANGREAGTEAAVHRPTSGSLGDGHSGEGAASDGAAGPDSVDGATCGPTATEQVVAAQCSGPGPAHKEGSPTPPCEAEARSRLMTPIPTHQPQRPGSGDCGAHSRGCGSGGSQYGDPSSAAGAESRTIGDAGRRISDAYFAAKLQAEDASRSCGTFVSASQLLVEAISEQRSLHKVVAASAHRTLPLTQSQTQWPQWQGTQTAHEQQLGAISRDGTMLSAQELCSACDFSPGLTQLQAPQQQPAQHQQQWPPAPGAVRPRWHRSGGSAAVQQDADVGGERSLWLAYVCDLYDQVPVPVTLATTATVGPLRRSDVPLSAVDFHVSDVVTRLMERQEVVAAAPGGTTGAPEDAEDALKSAMWLFRSSKNPKAWVHRLSPCCLRGPEGLQPCEEHHSLEQQLQREDDSRKRLAALWSAAAAWTDRFSVGYIARRFGPP